jgi:two-component system sensor histidine kinase/response regulator
VEEGKTVMTFMIWAVSIVMTVSKPFSRERLLATLQRWLPLATTATQTAAAAGDAEALRKTAHALKSSSSNVGAEQLATLCRELETLARKEAVDGAKPLLEVVEFELPRVLALLATILAESPDHATA